MFDPKLIFSCVWLLQIVLHLVFHRAFTPFETSTWVAMLLALLAFNCGACMVLAAGDKAVAPAPLDDAPVEQLVRAFFKVFMVGYAFLTAFAALQIFRFLVDAAQGELTLPLIREIVVNDFTNDRTLYAMFRVFYLGVGLSVFVTAFARHLTRRQLLLVLAVGLVSAIATTGRLYILLFFCATTALLYRNKIISGRSVVAAAAALVALFFLIAILLAKGDESGTVLERILWNAQVYFMSSISCFNDFVATGTQRMDGGAILPNPLRTMLSSLGMEIAQKPTLLPFAEVPVQCNTYTVLFPLFHDGAFPGIMLGLFSIGMLHQFLYQKYISTNSSTWWYLYAISLYPLVMSIFEDAYFSSPGFWLLLAVPPLAFRLFAVARSGWKAAPA